VRSASRAAAWREALGPGLLFAGSAVGTSHLIQATRAGADYGLGLLAVVLVAHLAKYPSFRFGPEYTAVTGRSLLAGYRRVGRWTLAAYLALFVPTATCTAAALTLVLAGLVEAASEAVLGGATGLGTWPLCALLLAGGGALLVAGRYTWLDRVNRVFVAVFTVTTLLATAFALARVDWALYPMEAPAPLALPTLLFAAALAGWMPGPVDVAVWQSLWVQAAGQTRDGGEGRAGRRAVVLDFHVGYLGTALLALCFLVMGAGVMHGTGLAFADSAPAFAAQVIGLYVQTLGAWAGPVVGLAAVSIMFTTCLAAYDAQPRMIAVMVRALRSSEDDLDEAGRRPVDGTPGYVVALVGLGLGALGVLAFLMASFQAFIDLVTTVAFVTAPLLAYLNHRLMHDPAHVPADARPPRWLTVWSWAGVAALSAFAVFFLGLKLYVG
jgi:Mn2+/Fe2+ NRAMP family transporter